MTWETKRLIGTLVSVFIPYLCGVFITWDFTGPLETSETRYILLLITLTTVFIVYTSPDWKPKRRKS